MSKLGILNSLFLWSKNDLAGRKKNIAYIILKKKTLIFTKVIHSFITHKKMYKLFSSNPQKEFYIIKIVQKTIRNHSINLNFHTKNNGLQKTAYKIEKNSLSDQ